MEYDDEIHTARTLTITLSSADAETILYALALRSKQKSISVYAQNDAVDLGAALDNQFATQFGWDKTINRMKHHRRLIKHVSVKGYDLPPAE